MRLRLGELPVASSWGLRAPARACESFYKSCGPSAALHEARNGVSHSVASCALHMGHICGFFLVKGIMRLRLGEHPLASSWDC